MATTVSYKGNTIATISNQTKTLTTSGKYMEDNVVLTDSNSVDNCPIFNFVYDENWNLTSTSCSMAFSEVYNLSSSDGGAVLQNDYTAAEREIEICGLNLVEKNQSYIRYSGATSVGQGVPSFDVLYNSDGTIELISGSTVTITKNITANGYYHDTGKLYSAVSVNVPASEPNLQSKTNISPTTSSQTITADSGYDGLSSVQINAMPTMTLPTSASSSSSGTSKATIGRSTSAQYINIPTGYNGTASYYTISATPNGSATTPATTITANPTITVSSSGLITATASASQNITPTVSAGYISSGTAGTVTVSGSKTQQLTTKGATIYNTSTTDQTIASGTYLTGVQTIKAVTVSGLDASKILSGTTVMVGDANDADRIASVTGTVTFSTITTSSSNPSGGSNGDIWIKTS